jgi:pSer/pThr/pTyr-binding forkhead associated (FHA) protein
MTTPATGLAEAFILSELLELPYGLAREHRTTFGRDTSNSIVLPTPLVSRWHAVIEWSTRGFVLVDAGSTNGTYVNGELVRRRRLDDGDRISIGPFDFGFGTRVDGGDRSTGGEETLILAAPGSFTGEIFEASLLEVWQMIELNQKTGVLEVRNGEERGAAFFSRGAALHAAYGDARGTAAALAILALERGRFRFTVKDQVSVPATIHGHATTLLVEAARRRDEAGRHRHGGTTRVGREAR